MEFPGETQDTKKKKEEVFKVISRLFILMNEKQRKV